MNDVSHEPALGAGSRSWTVRVVRGSAADLHRVDADVPRTRTLTLCLPARPAVVLGSTQAVADLDANAVRERGLDVVHRRSGGGAVFVHPDDSIWVDAWIPRDDALWDDDVSASMLWLGRAWVDAVSDRLDVEVITEPYVAGPWGRTVCFLSSAPGEVRGPRGKLVGISQRRDRDGARLQCVLYRRWEPTRWDVLSDQGASQALAEMGLECLDLEPHVVLDRLADALNRLAD